jgi:indole-3-glycerol phosphate synthase
MMTATILDEIIAEKKLEVAQRQRSLPVAVLQERISRREKPRDFASALRGGGLKLIAEVKKASPSRGVLCPDFDPVALARTYARSGAAAISVLTEVNHFQGRLEYLSSIREDVDVPLLRKDFIFDPYQVYESGAYGADALLLIAAILSPEQLTELLALSRRLGLGCLVEVHDEKEVAGALGSGAEIIGINNRDLSTFNVDIDTTRRLRPLIPEGRIVVSESGIKNRGDIDKLRDWGVDAVLVGEALVTAGDIPARIEELLT